MKVTEITDYSIVISKDSEDKPWLSLSDVAEKIRECYHVRLINADDNNTSVWLKHSVDDSFEVLCDGWRLIIFLERKFKEYDSTAKVGSSVIIAVDHTCYG